MAFKNTAPKTAARPASTRNPARPIITLKTVEALAPHAALAENLARNFGLDDVDYPAILESSEEHIALAAKKLEGVLNEKALEIHLQRIVGAHVASAHGAATFYQTKVTAARDLTSKLANEERDEDREGVAGFESRAARARLFAAQMGLQAFALMADAEGAVSAYAHIVGSEWKPYEGQNDASSNVARKSAAEEMAAFGA